MDVYLFDKQIDAFEYLSENNTEVNEILYGGGARGGKSYLGCVWQITRRIALPGSVGFIGREELTKLRDTTLITFFEVLKRLNVGSFFSFNAQNLTAKCVNSSMIFFRELKYLPSDPEFDRLGSYDLTDCFIDEAQQVSAKAISVLKGRFSKLRGQRADGSEWYTEPKALYSCNPKRNWIYSDFVVPFRNNALRSDRRFIKALPVDNPYTEQAYIDNLLKADQVTVQRLYYGNFEYDDDPTALIDFNQITDFWERPKGEAGMKRITADIARFGSDKAVIMYWNGFNISEIITFETSKTTDIQNAIRALKTKHGVLNHNIIADEDGVGGGVIDTLGCRGFINNSMAKNPSYANLKTECGYKLAELFDIISITAKVSNAVRDIINSELGQLKTYDSDKDGKLKILPKDKIKENIRRSPDYLDNFIMRMYFEVNRSSTGGISYISKLKS